VLLAGIWASTFLLQVPCHLRLSAGWDAATHRFLVDSNWIRTIAWTLRLVLAVAMLWRADRAAESASADLASPPLGP
jgi:hypothetical protein